MVSDVPFLESACVIIPTYNAAPFFSTLWPALMAQGIQPYQVLVVDSTSSDDTASRFGDAGARVKVIPQKEFNHGGTRRRAAEWAGPAEYLIFLTQDATPAHSDAFAVLLSAFTDRRVGMAYGRQLPRLHAGPIERHARETNYPACGMLVRELKDRERFGVKTVFCSDSFAAYRRQALEEVDSFPADAFFAEDQIVAGKMLLTGWKLAYTSEARVVHSHGYSALEEFKRYFDVGAFHARNAWLLDTFGHAEGEGMRFVISELRYLLRNAPGAIPSAGLRTLAKYVGYQLGRNEHRWSRKTKARLSMAPAYWDS